MIQLGKKPSGSKAHISRVRDKVEEMLPPAMEDVAVMVNQIECKEPGCPPIETVVSLLEEGAPKIFKVFKPVSEVTDEDLKKGLQELLSFGKTADEHAHTD
mmetsp:Transcript_18226/g.46994  ORF Transcript_18226/g.46994 Transcript_18226/m.46994 type:complete len:101 (-) Transcript_18226:181-483(-)